VTGAVTGAAADRGGRAAGRIFVPGRVRRHERHAIVAAVTRTESTAVIVHHVQAGDGTWELEAFQGAIDTLTARRSETTSR
jgi:hypothetical protein